MSRPIPIPGFIGGTYQSQSPNVDAQFTMNWYPELVESGHGKNRVVLYPTPGLAVFATLNALDNPIRALFELNGRCFGVGATNLVELSATGVVTVRGTLLNADRGSGPVSITGSANQLLFTSEGATYSFDLAINNLDKPAGLQNIAIAWVAFCDGYFLALDRDGRVFRISSLQEAKAWDALDFSAVNYMPDNIVAMLVDHREVWLFGRTSSVVYFNSGNADFPFEPHPGGYVEQGCMALASPAKLANGVYWLAGDSRGGPLVVRAHGYLPQRISTHAVEFAMQSYSRVDDAIGFAYQDQGHEFYQLTFPTADKTWVYDVVTGVWHQRGWWDGPSGVFEAHLARCHAYAFGKHLVGDRQSANIYEMSVALKDDAGNVIRRVRRSPHFSALNERIPHSAFQLILETGVGLSTGQGSDPLVMLRWSDDGGHQWSNEYTASAGKIGKYKTRAIWRRLGQSRDRIYEVAVSDPVAWRLIDAYLN